MPCNQSLYSLSSPLQNYIKKHKPLFSYPATLLLETRNNNVFVFIRISDHPLPLLMAVAFAFTAVATTCERFTVFLVVYHTAYNKRNYNHQYNSYYNCSQHNYTSDNISFNYFVAFKSFLESTFNVLLSLMV